MADNPEPYPEHAKQSKVAELAQEIGEFLEFGLPKMDLAIYQRVVRPYDADHRCARSPWHSEEEKETIVDKRVQVEDWRETHRSVQSILAEYFDIDLAKIDAEKKQMLEALRS